MWITQRGSISMMNRGVRSIRIHDDGSISVVDCRRMRSIRIDYCGSTSMVNRGGVCAIGVDYDRMISMIDRSGMCAIGIDDGRSRVCAWTWAVASEKTDTMSSDFIIFIIVLSMQDLYQLWFKNSLHLGLWHVDLNFLICTGFRSVNQHKPGREMEKVIIF